MFENIWWNLFDRKNSQVPNEVESGNERKLLSDEELFDLFVKDISWHRSKFKNNQVYERYLEDTRKNILTLSCNNCEDYERYHDKKNGWCAWCYYWKCINFVKDELNH